LHSAQFGNASHVTLTSLQQWPVEHGPLLPHDFFVGLGVGALGPEQPPAELHVEPAGHEMATVHNPN